MKRAFWIILTAVLALAIGLAAAESYEGTIVAGEIQPVAAAYGGRIMDLKVETGDLVEEGQELAAIGTTRNYAPVEGTVTGLYIAEGDKTEDITERYGASLYIEPTNRYLIAATSEKAYNASENRYVHLGERVYLKCVADGSHKGTGMISALTEKGYNVEVTGGEFLIEEKVEIYRKSNFSKESAIGRGTVSRANPVAVKGTGSVLKIHVANGDFVERGEILFETVDGVLDGLYAPGENIVSPVKGIIYSVEKARGETINKGDTLMKIMPTESLRVEFLVQESDLFLLKEGQKVRMELYWDTEPGRIYEGKITRISHIQEAVKDGTTATRQNYKVYASIQADEQIRAGMTVILSIDTGNAAAEEPAGEAEPGEEAPEAE